MFHHILKRNSDDFVDYFKNYESCESCLFTSSCWILLFSVSVERRGASSDDADRDRRINTAPGPGLGGDCLRAFVPREKGQKSRERQHEDN